MDQQLAHSMSGQPSPELQAAMQQSGQQGTPQAPQVDPTQAQAPMPPQGPQQPQIDPEQQEMQMIIKALISHMSSTEKRRAMKDMADSGLSLDGTPLGQPQA